MADTPWMQPGVRSGEMLIDDPDAPAEEVAAARARLDEALGAVTNPEGPAWYRPVARLGRRWYLVCAAAGVVLLLFTALPWYVALLLGLCLGPALGAFSGAILSTVARGISVTPEVRAAATAARQQEYPWVRSVLPGTIEMVRGIIAHAPERAAQVHHLAWALGVVAFDDPLDERAAAALDQLWKDTAGAAASVPKKP